MLFMLPFMAAKVAIATLTVGEAIGISATAFGIGAGIKGAVDYQRAKKLKAEADEEYREMASRIRRRAERLKKSSETLAA
jgi:TusA-related sulfurtransferase